MRAAALLLLTTVAMGGAPAEAAHQPGHGTSSGPAPKMFAPDFVPPKDSEWGFDIGGFGGEQRGKPLLRNPVIFVHGNGDDASFYTAGETPPAVVNVRQRMRGAGYADQEIWALSYNGARCGTQACATENDPNVADMYNFIQAVRDYTGAQKVDIVAHSLGVTLVRKTVFTYPELLSQIEDFVAAAGANHGTTSCRGFETSYYGCDEIAPGTAWLRQLNTWNPDGGNDETPGTIRYMTIFDGTGAGDQFYLRIPGVFDDTKSPRLEGAEVNLELPNTPHYTLVRGEVAFNRYLPFIRDHNEVAMQTSAPISTGSAPTRASGRRLASTGPRASAPFGFALLVLGLAAMHLVRGRSAT